MICLKHSPSDKINTSDNSDGEKGHQNYQSDINTLLCLCQQKLFTVKKDTCILIANFARLYVIDTNSNQTLLSVTKLPLCLLQHKWWEKDTNTLRLI